MNPYGRPKVSEELKAVKFSVSLRPAQIEHVKKSGGSKYIQSLIDREIAQAAEAKNDETGENRTKSAKNSDADSILIRRLKRLSQNFASE